MSLPGAFPSLSPLPLAAYADEYQLHLDTLAKKHQSASRASLLTLLDIVTTSYIVIVFLYDYNLVLFLLRLAVQSLISLLDTSLNRLVPALTVYCGLVWGNLLPMVVHLVYGQAVSSRADGYVFGHYVIQVIGQKQLSSPYPLVMFDMGVFVLQMVLFDLHCGLAVVRGHRLGADLETAVEVDLLSLFTWKYFERLVRNLEEMAEASDTERLTAIGQLYDAV